MAGPGPLSPETVGQSTLTPLVRKALASPQLVVSDWQLTRLSGGAGGGLSASELIRFSGHAQDGQRSVPWALVLKILNARTESSPTQIDYWKREAEAYRSGFFAKLPRGLGAPQCHGLHEVEDSCWLWLEDVSESLPNWPLRRYGLAARHLGRLSGAYLRQPMPAWPWLSTKFIREDLGQIEDQIERLASNMKHPLLSRFLPGDAGHRMLGLFAERERFLRVLDQLPQTLCHFDAFRRNMFARRRGAADETVLIDWAFVGQGPIGAEIVSTVWVTLCFLELGPSHAEALETVVFNGYMSGLHDTGWTGDERLARLGFTAAIGLRRLGTFGHMLPSILEPGQYVRMEELWLRPINEIADHYSRIGAVMEKLTDEARELMAVV